MSNINLDGLHSNLASYSDAQQQLISALLEAGQAHLFADWHAPGSNDDAKDAFLATLEKVNANEARSLELTY